MDVDWGSEAQGAASGAASGAVFGPYGAMAGAAIGMVLTAFGSYEKQKGSERQIAIQTGMIQTEEQQEALRYHSAVLQANRMQMENVRNMQRARALAIANATNSGAQFGSGLPGGEAQISAQGGLVSKTIGENLDQATQMFSLNQQLSQQKIQMAQTGSLINTGTGLQSLGQSISQNNKLLYGLANQGYQGLKSSFNSNSSSNSAVPDYNNNQYPF